MITYLKNIAWDIYGIFAWENNRTPSHFFNFILNAIESDNQHFSILDVGCGTGIHSQPLANRLHKVIGIDISKSMITNAKKKINNTNKTLLSFQCGDLNKKLPFHDSQFDVILCISVLQTLVNPAYTLSELYRVLKFGGKIFLVHHSQYFANKKLAEEVSIKFNNVKKQTLTGRLFLYLKTYLERNGFSKYWSEGQLLKLLSESNFSDIKTFYKKPIVMIGYK